MPAWVGALLSFLYDALTVVAHITAIFAYGIAIYVFVRRRNDISSIFRSLLDYSRQLSFSELKEKLETLREYDADNPNEQNEVINILSDIQGQILGSAKLKTEFSDVEKSIDVMVSDRKQLTESRKRKVVSETKERLRHLSVMNMDSVANQKEIGNG